jgi:hypothetical protein
VIGAEIQAAKAGAKVTWEGIKVVVYAVVLLALAGWLFANYLDNKKRDRRLEGLETFKTSVDAQDRVTDAATGAFAQSQQSLQAQSSEQQRVLIIHETEQRKAANEDPDTRVWLDGRIPQRLRDADARARESGRLGHGDRTRGDAR